MTEIYQPGVYRFIDLADVPHNYIGAANESVTVNSGATGLIFASSSGGGVTSVSGTTGQIDVANGTTTPVISIDTGYVGQTSITILGTIGSGLWQGTAIAPAYMTTMTATVGGAVPTPPNNITTFLRGDGTFATPAGGSPAGSTGYIQFNNSGSFAADSNLFWDNTNKILGIGTSTPSRTLDVVGTTSSTVPNVLNILGGIGIAGTTGGQAVSITTGIGKTWIPSSKTVGRGGNISLSSAAGGDLNDNTITGIQTAGGGGAFILSAASGGNLTDTPNSASVTLKGGLGGGYTIQSGPGGDASLLDLTNTTGGDAGSLQFIAQGGGASQSQSIVIGGKGGAMSFSLFSGGSVVAGSGATSATGGNTGDYSVTIGNAGSVTRSGTQNSTAISKGGNSGSYIVNFGNGGGSTILASAGTSTGGNAGNGIWTGANGGSVGGTGTTRTGGNGTGYSFITGKGGTGTTANGTDGDFTIKDGYGNTVLTAKGNNTSETIFGGAARLKGYTVATLPTGNQGDTAFVTDALAPSFLSIIVGGGTVVTPVFYNGTNWVGY